MSFKIGGFFSNIEHGIEQAISTVGKAVQPVVSAVEHAVENTTTTAKPLTSNFRMGDIGSSLIRSQLHAAAPAVKAAPATSSSASISFNPFNPSASLGLLGQLAGGFVSSLV